jgi:hypothetical protein
MSVAAARDFDYARRGAARLAHPRRDQFTRIARDHFADKGVHCT